MQELAQKLKNLNKLIDTAWTKLKLDLLEARLAAVQQDLKDPAIWQDHKQAADLAREEASLTKQIEPWRELRQGVAEALELTELNDASLEAEILASFGRLEARYKQMEGELKLSGPHDASSAILNIRAGAGGTDAQDWAEMLMRMYLRYAEQHDFEATVLEMSRGEEAGIKSVTLEVSGPFAYGKLKGEHGVHRLVRLSPFNADNLRQTSFALVEVWPQIIGPGEIEIDPADLKIDVYRSSGPGGQSVNTTDSAVRITHIPTGIVVAIQSERSQLQNREKAMAVLRARLVSLMEEQHQAEVAALKGPSQQAAWGNQIRSYVLHPYNLVKDHRTSYETAKTEAVLNGGIEPFIDAYLNAPAAQAQP